MSENTVCKRLQLSGLLSLRAAKKPFNSPKNRKAGIEYTNVHRHWNINDWKRVLWSDEPKYNLKGPDENLKVRRPKRKRLDPKYTSGTVKHGGGKSGMVWGCFYGFSEVRPIHRINGIMDNNLFDGYKC